MQTDCAMSDLPMPNAGEIIACKASGLIGSGQSRRLRWTISAGTE